MKRVIGGAAAYKAVINELYYGKGLRMHNPAIYYKLDDGIVSPAGFFVSSNLIQHNDDEIWILDGSIDANTGETSVRPYVEVAEIIFNSPQLSHRREENRNVLSAH